MVHLVCIPFYVQHKLSQLLLYAKSLKATYVGMWLYVCMYVQYLLNQTPLSISRRSRIVAAPPDVLNEIVTALEY